MATDNDSPIRFRATPQRAGGRTILRLPHAASEKLPSRGQVAVRGRMDGHAFETVIEPDGESGHWLEIEATLQEATGTAPGEEATVDLELAAEWPETDVPEDLRAALSAARSAVQAEWRDITAMARWEWVRWINAAKRAPTRLRRVEASISMLADGKRRPCCFNLASCTDPDLSKGGKLVLD